MKRPAYLFSKNHSGILQKSLKTVKKIALFLDFDGTLVPIQKDPEKCFLTPEIKKQLRLLTNAESCCVSVMSGRKLSDIRKRIAVPGIYYSGNHGIDIAGPGIRYTHPKASSIRPVILKIKHLLGNEIAGIKGAWLEDKKFTLTLHFRTVKKVDISSVKKAFYKIAGNFFGMNLLTVIKGKKVLELTPDISWDKGKAVLLIMKKLKGKCLPIYIGDDQTDETAFKALYRKGITIRVGKSRRTFAEYYLKNYLEVTRLLDQLKDFKQAKEK